MFQLESLKGLSCASLSFYQEKKLVSSWYNDKSLPQDCIFPPDKRSGKDHAAAPCNSIPVIDLGKADYDDWNHIIQQILDASQEFGFFQVINHGVSERLMDDTMNLFLEFFDMPNEDKAEFFPEDSCRKSTLFTSNNYYNEGFHLWRNNFVHSCNPVEEWPTKPARYGLTLGLPKHCDPNLITAVQQGDIPGLQVFKDAKWIGVEPLPNAFVVDIGYQLQIITNGKLKSSEHRAVISSTHARTTIVTFLVPDSRSIIEPAKALTDNKPPLYRAFKNGEFLSFYTQKVGDPETVLEPFKLKN
ncbi:hypothetical protein M9H77_01331 [Catharanthus roseus]|uniref:Uncharacterized protein n=1 Tax=Catharanthus roseus TaxID=4058 RepID=A0ACC0C5A4_CATRO|nr:hypothetical protein M9H77_01331 [Catharanthus roseus]